MYNANLIPKEHINMIWVWVKPFIVEACETANGLCDSNDYKILLENGNRQLWVVSKDKEIVGVVVTTINKSWRNPVMQIDICDGRNLDEWINLISLVEDFGRQNGCDRMWLMGRAGYERKLKHLDYKKTHIFLEKIL